MVRRKKKTFVRSAANTAMQALRVANQVKGLLNVEFKYHDTTQTGVAVSDDGIQPQICDPAQGDAQQQRDGDSIRVKRLVIRGYLKFDAQIADGSMVRLCVVRSTRGALAPLTNMIDPNYYGTALSPIFHKNYENRKHYKIMKDLVFKVTPDTIAVPFKINMKLDHKVEFDAGSTSPTANAFYLLCISDADAGGTDFPLLTYVSRMYYVDN